MPPMKSSGWVYWIAITGCTLLAFFLLIHAVTTYTPAARISNQEQEIVLLGSLALSLVAALATMSQKGLSTFKKVLFGLPALLVLAIGSWVALTAPNNTKWLSTFAAVFGFFSFHFLFSDGWSFDGTWSKLREIRERLYPLPENRSDGWWHGTTGYFCAALATIFWIWASWKSK